MKVVKAAAVHLSPVLYSREYKAYLENYENTGVEFILGTGRFIGRRARRTRRHSALTSAAI